MPFYAAAEGFRNPPAGAFNLGRAGGRFAHVDDASAVAQNPANLMDLDRAQFEFTPSIVYIKSDYKSEVGLSAHTQNPWNLLPNAFIVTPIADGKFAAGLGITTPFGLAVDWDNTGAFAPPAGNLRYTSAHLADLKTVNFNPTLAARLDEHVQIGVGLDVFYSQLELQQYYPWSLVSMNPADPDGNIKAEGDGVGFGGNFGVTVTIADRHRLAFTLRSSVKVEYEGDFRLNNVPAALGGGGLKSSFGSSITFPTIVGAGYGIQVTENFRLEADVEWLEFSDFDSLPLEVEAPPPGVPNSVAQKWDNTFTAGIAGDYRFGSKWVVRAGYQFYESPVPDYTFSPAIPDANQNVITVGIAYKTKHHSFEFAYGYDFYDTRRIKRNQNPAFLGTYDITVHLFSLAYRFTF